MKGGDIKRVVNVVKEGVLGGVGLGIDGGRRSAVGAGR